jgi:hypothetical protein
MSLQLKNFDSLLVFLSKMPKKPNYECIRCGYETEFKTNIHKHLFLKKTPCPQTKNLIVLTDDIKQHIIDNRIYIIPPPVKVPKVTNIITNNNTINNLIVNMDTIDKITKYTDYKHVDLIDFDESVDMKMRNRADKFRAGDSKVTMNIEFIEDIKDASKNKTIDDFNIFYESKIKTINIYKNGEWNKMHVTDGIAEIIETMQSSLWDEYEYYLIKKIESSASSYKNRQECKEHLEKYYKFIGCFDVEPDIKDKSDKYILSTEIIENNGAGELSEKYMKLYRNTYATITRSESKDEAKKIIDIISHNTIHSIKDMNKTVINLFNMDEEFKKLIV